MVKQRGSRIAHVHFKDAIGRPEMERFLFPLFGEGSVDWHASFAALQEIGYTGFCSVEFESDKYYRHILKRDPEETARLSLELVDAMLKR